MNMKFKTIVLALVAFIRPGLSIKCLQCNSAEDARCLDVNKSNSSSLFLKECDGSYNNHEPFCRKFVTHIVDSKETRVVRSCGWIIDDSTFRIDYCGRKDTDFIFKENCGCFTDGCNSSINLGLHSYVVLFCLIPYALKCLITR
ncbi:uncharacterized protein LOC143206933 [Rhynchophorus ferrugineus]|uniref:Protein sleepless n=1 Tax=Rhynchophorus ferrugineus TaxID=354439 RepID=A0A834I2M4_RHYFE|nr:hypothetical protein GWI33_020897 [Rhynchophorus ferrugineus]